MLGVRFLHLPPIYDWYYATIRWWRRKFLPPHAKEWNLPPTTRIYIREVIPPQPPGSYSNNDGVMWFTYVGFWDVAWESQTMPFLSPWLYASQLFNGWHCKELHYIINYEIHHGADRGITYSRMISETF